MHLIKRAFSVVFVSFVGLTNAELAMAQSETVKSSSSFSRPTKWKFETPIVGSDQWKKEQAEKARLDKQTETRLRAICSKC